MIDRILNFIPCFTVAPNQDQAGGLQFKKVSYL